MTRQFRKSEEEKIFCRLAFDYLPSVLLQFISILILAGFQVCFAHPREAIKIVEIVRSQLAHNFLFESLVRAHYPTASRDGAVTIRLSVHSVHNYDFVFELDRNMFVGMF